MVLKDMVVCLETMVLEVKMVFLESTELTDCLVFPESKVLAEIPAQQFFLENLELMEMKVEN